MSSLFIFLDESGNLDFSAGGTRHFVLSAVTAFDPLQSSSALQSLKYRFLMDGVDIKNFHASEDRQAIRNDVFAELQTLHNLRVNYIFADKSLAHPSLHDSAKFYSLLGTVLMKYMVNGYRDSTYDKIIIVFDKTLRGKDQHYLLQSLKSSLKELGKPFEVYFHQTMYDFNSQIADYAAWAAYVSLEKGEMRPLTALGAGGIPVQGFNIFNQGTHHYY